MAQADGRRTIAILIPSLAIGGAERQALELAGGLDPAKWRVLVLTIAQEPPPAQVGTGVTHLWAGPAKGAALVARLATLLRRERVDVLQAYLLGSQIYAVAAKALVRDLKLIVAVRSSAGLREILGWKGKISHAVVFGLRALVDRYVFNSSAGERALGRRLPPDRRRVIVNGIDTTRFRPDADAGAGLRAICGAPRESRLVGIVANVNQDKGYESFVRAADIVAREMADVFFVAVGEHRNPLGARTEALVAELSLTTRFCFLGPRSDPERIVPGLDLLCSASSTEGFSNAIGEAMACGVPCVVTAVGDSPSIVGETGVVVAPDDAPALAAGLRTLLEEGPDQRKRRGRAARRRIEENFGVPQMVESFDRLYESLLPVRPGARPDPPDQER